MSPEPSRHSSTRWQLISAPFIYLALAFTGMMPGSLGMFHLWQAWFEDPTACYRIWWFSNVIYGGGGSIWELPLLLYPNGINTMMQSNGIGKELLFAVLGGGSMPWLAGNIFAVTTPATVAFCAFLMLRKLLRGAYLPALVGGWMAGWSGYFLGQKESPWMASVEGLALFLGVLLLMRRRGSWPLMVAAGAAAALAVWIQIQLLVHIIVLAGIFAVDQALLRRWRNVGFIFLSGVIGGILAAPLLHATWQSYGGNLELMAGSDPAEAMFTWRNRVNQFFLPHRDVMPLGLISGWLMDQGWRINPHPVPYCGWAAMILAFIGWRTKRRGTGFLAAVVVIFTVLSFGPVISFFEYPMNAAAPDGTRTSYFGPTWIPGPFLFMKDLPVFGSMRVPGRFIMTAQVALGFLAAFGVLRVLRHDWIKAVPLRRPAAVALLLLLHFDVNMWPVQFAPNQYTRYWEKIAATEGDFAVLDIPYGRGMHQYMHYGAYHQKGVIWGFGSRVPTELLDRVEGDFRFPGVIDVWEPEAWHPDPQRMARSLVEYRVRYVVFHKLHLLLTAPAFEPVRREHPHLLEVYPQLVAFWQSQETWAAQELIETPRVVHEDDRVLVLEIRPRGGSPE